MSPPELPPEILDNIIDNIALCTDSVMACSLVSKQLLPRCRKHLFRHIIIKQIDVLPSPKNKELVTYLLRPDSFGAHVWEVELHLISTPWILAQPFLISVLQHVKRCEIHALKLKFVGHYVSWNLLSADFRFAMQDLFILSSLATLHLAFIHSLPLNILPACITMRELYLEKAFFYTNNAPKRLTDLHNCSRLQSLSISNSGDSLKLLVGAISAHSEVSRLRKLDMEGPDDIYSLQRLLNYASASLEHLHLKDTKGTIICMFTLPFMIMLTWLTVLLP